MSASVTMSVGLPLALGSMTSREVDSELSGLFGASWKADAGSSSGGDPKGYFASATDAAAYLERNGYALWEDAGSGALVGYNGAGEAIGKWSDGTVGPDVPKAVIVAYMMTNDPGWQRVERKGKRGRGGS